MEYTRVELKYLKLILIFKYEKGYKCKRCGCDKSSWRWTPPAKICTNMECRYEELITANTAFHHSKIPVHISLNILIDIQKHYINFIKSLENQVYSRYDSLQTEFENKKLGWKTARPSLEKLAKKYQLQRNTVRHFIKKIAGWIPNKYSIDNDADSNWWNDLKSDKSKKRYSRLFHLLFVEEEPRSKVEILYILVTKKLEREKYGIRSKK